MNATISYFKNKVENVETILLYTSELKYFNRKEKV